DRRRLHAGGPTRCLCPPVPWRPASGSIRPGDGCRSTGSGVSRSARACSGCGGAPAVSVSVLADLNWLDWLVVVVLVLSAANGTRRGFLVGTLDLVSAAVALGVAFVWERPVADSLVRLVPAVAPALAHLGAFLVLLFGVQT